MQPSATQPGSRDAAAVVLGYLNFSSGAFDAAAWRAMSELYAAAEPAAADGAVEEAAGTPDRVASELRNRLAALRSGEPAFREAGQAAWAIDTAFLHVLPGYRRFHADLLEHQPPGAIERPFFVMSALRAILASGGPEDDRDAVVARAIDRLDDYVGWRPLAVLENGRLSAPYPHERVAPIPLAMAGAGPAHGRYRRLVAGALEILHAAPAELLRQADFDLDALEELAIDPRAFDFLHPAASRPNYLFGLWDPGRIDSRGLYRRMVVQQATLDGILSWPEAAAEAGTPGDAAEFHWESSAVLAGVMLMASGLSGHGPGALQSSMPLAELLPRIASYRDEFYRRLLATLPGQHRVRLEEEARRVRQPFGGVRRHINAMLARRRARQVEHVALAAVLARVGRAEGAERLVGAVPAASARMLSRITSRVVAARQAVWRRDASDRAIGLLDEAADLLGRAVGCGAIVDPWNILGLSGQFPLHEPGGESLPDPRVDDLVNTTSSILEGYAAVWRQASLAGEKRQAAMAAAALERLAAWWDRYATTTVSGMPHLSGRECVDSTGEVIAALERRRDAEAGPPTAFWKREVAAFSSPRSHAQAADALLDEGDLDGAAGLLVHWASLLEGPAIERSGPAWLAAAARWVAQATADRTAGGRGRVRRFLDKVEANTATVVDVIADAAVAPGIDRRPGADADDADADADGEERVAAAYESMVWRDSADDGVDGGMIDADGRGGGSLDAMSAVEDAAEFVRGVLRLFREAVAAWCADDAATGAAADPEELATVTAWGHGIRRLRRTLLRAATLVALRDQEPPPGMSPAEFDRLRWQRDAAAERLVEAAVQAGETTWILAARRRLGTPGTTSGGPSSIGGLVAAFLRGDAAAATARAEAVCARMVGRPVLYVPLSRGGRADRVVKARTRERVLERMAACLPRLGLVQEAVAVVQLAKSLESRRPQGGASVSEFDRVFEAATTALVERIVESSGDGEPSEAIRTERILDALSMLVPRLLETWMTHARQLRLSVLERVRDDRAFAATRDFVERYGQGLFTQHLLAPSSLRGILRGGVRKWLEQLVERSLDGDDEGPAARRPRRLVEDLVSGVLPMKQAATRLRLILESIAENHAEYRDWNSTTTQSDRGECLHILLDHLRVKAEHDRIAWTLRPVTMAHRVLARRGATAAAAAWRARLRDETQGTAAELVRRLDRLEGQWSVRLASVSDRIRRPFTAMLEQDDLESLVEPAVAELVTAAPAGAGAALEAKATGFLGTASGAGVEVPDWLERLSAGVERAIERTDTLVHRGAAAGLPQSVPWANLPWDALKAALAG